MFLRRLIILTPIWILLCANALAGTTHVVLKQKVTVKSPTICLSDVADFKNKDNQFPGKLLALDLGNSPQPGYNRFIQKEIIESRIKRLGFTRDDVVLEGADGVLVSIQTVLLSGDELGQLGLEFIQNRLKDLKGDRAVEISRPAQDILVPAGNSPASFKMDWRGGPRSAGLASVDIQILVEDKIFTTVTTQYTIRSYTKVLIATADIMRGDAFTEQNTKLVRTETTSMTSRPVRALSELDQRLCKRKIRAGCVIRLDDGYFPAIVERGNIVSVVVRKGSLKIKTKGVALRSGRLGDSISVRNPDSNKTFNAKVTGPDSVEINLK